MKIFVFSDLHGYADTFQKILDAIRIEQPNKVVFCGDLFGGWSSTEKIVALTKQIDAVTYFVRGNNDIFYPNVEVDFEEYAIMHHFGKTMFFSHGHIYNGYKLPSFIGEGDVLVHGHTHTTHFYNVNGVMVVNVGSCAIPRDKTPSYIVMDEGGVTQKSLDGKDIFHKDWN